MNNGVSPLSWRSDGTRKDVDHDVFLEPSDEGLNRGLHNRHIQLIALGGAIGVGLFLASGAAIHSAGPGVLLSYTLGGIVAFFLLRALGELALYRPVSGSFASYATEFLGPFAGFYTGWTYWATYVLVGMLEVTAVGKYIQYWAAVPQWAVALVALIVLVIANSFSVRIFGETEFWFAIIKVLTIIGLILVGIAVLTLGISKLAHGASVSNLWRHGGFFPHGFFVAFLVLPVVLLSFNGLETIGIAAGETEDPKRILPKAINRVIVRVAIFYVGSLTVIMSLVAWNKLNPKGSPFLFIFDQIGFPAAATVVNFVVITAALSVGNSSMFVTGRMLFSLAERHQAPAIFARLSKRRIPIFALALSASLMMFAVALNYLAPGDAFEILLSLTTVGTISTWMAIVGAHLGYWYSVRRGQIVAGEFRMPGAPWTNIIVLGFLVVVTVLLGFKSSTRLTLYAAPGWILLVSIAFWLSTRASQQTTSS